MKVCVKKKKKTKEFKIYNVKKNELLGCFRYRRTVKKNNETDFDEREKE